MCVSALMRPDLGWPPLPPIVCSTCNIIALGRMYIYVPSQLVRDDSREANIFGGDKLGEIIEHDQMPSCLVRLEGHETISPM